MNYKNLLINSVCCASTFAEWTYFHKNMSCARRVQEKLLRRLIRQNSRTEFGQQHQFSRINDFVAFQQKIPIMNYEQYVPLVHKISEGKENVLTRDPVNIFEPTGGSQGGSKLIPYTQSLKKEFQRGIKPWLFDISQEFPEIWAGKHYWSITPSVYDDDKTSSGIPIGFEDDSDYFGFVGKFLRLNFAVPQQIRLVKNMENFKYLTSYFLLLADDLTFISIWNPTFLMLIVSCLESQYENLVRDIKQGTMTLPVEEDIVFLKPFFKQSAKRAEQLSEIFRGQSRERYSKVWNKLVLISCWEDGPSAYFAQQLRKVFPGVRMQAKGLLATEGIVTIPLFSAQGCVPAYTSHVIEFLKENEPQPRWIDELEVGDLYTVIITTSGGLYRYNLQDRVEVTGKYCGLPILKFIGRERFSDLVGEKLKEEHVAQVIRQALESLSVHCELVFLAPHKRVRDAGYILFIEPKRQMGQEVFSRLIRLVEEGLMQNFHYQYARAVGQLLSLKGFMMGQGSLQAYMDRCVRDGQKLGDIKVSAIDRREDWLEYLKGQLQEMHGNEMMLKDALL